MTRRDTAHRNADLSEGSIYCEACGNDHGPDGEGLVDFDGGPVCRGCVAGIRAVAAENNPPASGSPSAPVAEAGAGALGLDQQKSIAHKWRRGGPKDDRGR